MSSPVGRLEVREVVEVQVQQMVVREPQVQLARVTRFNQMFCIKKLCQ